MDVQARPGKTAIIFCPRLLEIAHPRRFERTISTVGNGRSRFVKADELELTGSTGGYGNISQEEVAAQGLPTVQLYDLENDIGETNNL